MDILNKELHEHFLALTEAIDYLWPKTPYDNENWEDIKEFIKQRDNLIKKIDWRKIIETK